MHLILRLNEEENKAIEVWINIYITNFRAKQI